MRGKEEILTRLKGLAGTSPGGGLDIDFQAESIVALIEVLIDIRDELKEIADGIVAK